MSEQPERNIYEELVEGLEALNQDYCQENQQPLEGVVQSPQTKEKVFKNLSAMADYIKTFNIQSGRYQLCYTHDKQSVFLLQYERAE